MKLSDLIQEPIIYDIIGHQEGLEGVIKMTTLEFLSLFEGKFYLAKDGKLLFTGDGVELEIEPDFIEIFTVFADGDFEGAYFSKKKATEVYEVVSIIHEIMKREN